MRGSWFSTTSWNLCRPERRARSTSAAAAPPGVSAARPPPPSRPRAAPAASGRFSRPRLPGYMTPAAFVALAQMPLTPDGDPAPGALKHPQIPQPRHGHGEQRTPTQAGMSHLWSELLKKEQVSLDDDFFALGGNSLLAAEMLAHARVMFGISADYVRPLTRCLLRDPTLRGFAKATQDARAGRLAAQGAQTPVDFARDAELAAPALLNPHPQC